MMFDNYERVPMGTIIIYTNKRSLLDHSNDKFKLVYIEYSGTDHEFSRYIKMSGFKILNKFPSIYVDSSVKVNIEKLNEIFFSSGLVFFNHPDRKLAHEELIYNFLVGKGGINSIFKFIYYSFKRGIGGRLALGGIIIVSSNEYLSILDNWKIEYKALGIDRDQISLAYVKGKTLFDLPDAIYIGRNSFKPRFIIRVILKIKRWIK